MHKFHILTLFLTISLACILNAQQEVKGVYVKGAVNKESFIPIPENRIFRVQDAIQRVGGLSPLGDTFHVQIQRKSDLSTYIIQGHLNEFLISNDKEVLPQDGDIIYVPDQTPKVTVAGAVPLSGFVYVPKNGKLTLIESISKAGGLFRYSRGNVVRLLRREGGKQNTHVINVYSILRDFEKGKNSDILLLDGDVIFV